MVHVRHPKSNIGMYQSHVSTWAFFDGPRSSTSGKEERKVFSKAFQLPWNFHLEKKTTFLSVKLHKRDNCGIACSDLYAEIIPFANGNYPSAEMGLDVGL